MDHESKREMRLTGLGRSVTFAAIFALMMALLIIGTAKAYEAAGISLSGMTDDEVVALLGQVNAEIASRHIEKTATLPSGAYIVGEDIPAGRYIYTCLAQGNDWGNVTVKENRGSGRQLTWTIVCAPEGDAEPETLFFTLNDGEELKSDVPFSLTVSAGVVFK